MSIDQLYQGILLDHNRQPRNFKRLDGVTHSARGQDASCGDDLLMELEVRAGTIVQAAFSGEACAVTKASASMLTEWLIGRSVTDVADGLLSFRALLETQQQQTLDEPDSILGELVLLQPVGAFPARRRNALLPWRTVLKALDMQG